MLEEIKIKHEEKQTEKINVERIKMKRKKV